MLDQDDIDHQRKLLEAHRRTLAHSLEQYTALGVLTPPALVHNIREAWTTIAQIKATLRADGIEIDDDPNDEPRELHITIPTLTPTERRNRQRMLQKVRDFWVKGVLENSLHGAALIELGMEYKPDAVQHPWEMVIQQPDQPTRSIPPGTKIIEVFDEVGGELLILGAPGSGKTTMLLELARDLIARAEQDESYPMPVVFNLSSWAERRKPLVEWLADELNTKYDVPRKIGNAWVGGDQVLPLLDGLDEVRQEYRGACVETLNVFRQGHGLVNIVICSRVADYEALTERLRLQDAVLVQPLTTEQIGAYLASAGDQLTALRAMLIEDDPLRELAASPLMFSIMTLAYQGLPAESLPERGAIEDRRKHLFAAYVVRMFVRRGVDGRYSYEQTMRWLRWLARRLIVLGHIEFHIERLQPFWLLSDWSPRFYRAITELPRWLSISVFYGLFFSWQAGLYLGLTLLLAELVFDQPMPTLFRLNIGLPFVLGTGALSVHLFGWLTGVIEILLLGWRWLLLLGLPRNSGTIEPVEVVVWSWRHFWSSRPTNVLAFAVPNEGIRRSARHAIRFGLIGVTTGLGIGVSIALIILLLYGLRILDAAILLMGGFGLVAALVLVSGAKVIRMRQIMTKV